MPLWLIGYGLKALAWGKDALRYLFGHPMALVAVLCAVFGLVEHHEADKWAKVAETRGIALKQAQGASDMELARATAERDAAIRQAKDADNEADHRVELARADDARARDMLVQRLRGAREGNGGALPASAAAHVSESDHGPGDAPAGDDAVKRFADVCVANTRRLWEAHLEAVPGDKPAGF